MLNLVEHIGCKHFNLFKIPIFSKGGFYKIFSCYSNVSKHDFGKRAKVTVLE